MRPVPETLFKYQPMTLQAVRNLRAQGVYFCPPDSFNDPFDCNVTPDFVPLKNEAARQFVHRLLKEQNVPRSKLKELKTMPTEEIQRILQEQAEQLFVKRRGGFQGNQGISCFTEDHTNLLMWSHYGGEHYGFCSEFKTDCEPLTKIRPVEYIDEIPRLNLGKLYLEGDWTEIMKLYCSKGTHWGYEKEWRSIHANPAKMYTFKPETLKAIYFGARMPESDMDLLSLILYCQNPDVELYTAHLCNDRYGLNFEPATYSPPGHVGRS